MKIQTITVTCKRRAGDQDLNSESSPKAMLSGNSLEVQCLGLGSFMPRSQGVPFMVSKLRSQKPHGLAKVSKQTKKPKKAQVMLYT